MPTRTRSKPRATARPRPVKGWPPERRARQAAAIRRWQPWTRSTGPRTDTGKSRSRHNALRHGLRGEHGKILLHLLRRQRRFVLDVNSLLKSMRNNGMTAESPRARIGADAFLHRFPVMHDSKQIILNFWFNETEPQLWFQQSEDFDAIMHQRFMSSCELVRDGLCDSWNHDVDGCLALTLLLHTFPRHIYRGHAKAYAGDGKALIAAKQAVARGFDQTLQPVRRRFLYLPYMHSENRANQKKSVELFGKMQKDDPLSYEHALRNARIIDQFGRFPHRNKILGRENAPEEDEWLSVPA